MANSFTPQQIEQFLQEFFDVVGARQYIGARYVPIFGRAGEDTVEWDDGAPYEPLTVVMHLGVSYVSRRYVPTGTQITDTDYWVETYRFNAQVEQYRQEVLGFQDQIARIREDMESGYDQIREDMESDYVPFPDSDTYPKYGILGQVLTTLANGGTKWEDPVTVDAEIAEPLIEEWLDTHPEATTTVQDGAITWPKLADALKTNLLHATNVVVLPSNYSTSLPDADLQTNNAVHFITNGVVSGMTQNLPVYGQYGVLFKVNHSPSNVQGGVQFYATCPTNLSDAALYYRVFGGVGDTPTFTAWKSVNVPSANTLTFNMFKAAEKSNMFHATNMIVTSSNYSTALPDADLQTNNAVHFLNNTVESDMTQHLPVYQQYGVLFKVNYSPSNTQGGVQFYATCPTNLSDAALYYRVFGGVGDTPTFTAWKRLANESSINRRMTSSRTCSIFKKVVACGDSYTAGWINNDTTNEDYAWPHYMETITGHEWVNCGHSGATVLSWQTLTRGLAKAQSAGVAQAYVIGLMINDVSHVTLGTQADIGTQAQTYYGGLSQIVEELNAISPNAKIFIQTCPRAADSFQPYNQAVRDVVDYYANTKHTHLLDLYAYIDLYDIPSINGDAKLSHYTAIGYQQFAENLAYVMSDYINKHISAFQDVYSLPTS